MAKRAVKGATAWKGGFDRSRCRSSGSRDNSEFEKRIRFEEADDGSNRLRREDSEGGEGARHDRGHSSGRRDSCGGEDLDEEQGHLVVVVNRFLFAQDMQRKFRPKRRLNQGLDNVWELGGVQEEVTTDAIAGICRVMSTDDVNAGVECVGDEIPTFVGEGFVGKARTPKRFKIALEPWRKSGSDGWFFDRRSPSVYENIDHLPIFSMGLLCASDGFNLFSLGGRKYSINATYLAGCLSPALLRRLRS